MKKWTENQIVALLNKSDRAVELAVVAIYERQTTDEKASDTTNHDNNRGFQHCDARRGSYWARLVKSGRKLFPSVISKARPMCIKYRRQLTEVANAAEAKKVDAQEDKREAKKANFTDSRYEPIPGTYAFTARLLAQSGMMTGEEADRWKDEMKDASMND
jgi:hypothetical protein